MAYLVNQYDFRFAASFSEQESYSVLLRWSAGGHLLVGYALLETSLIAPFTLQYNCHIPSTMNDTDNPDAWSPESPFSSPLSPTGWIAFYQSKPGAAETGVEVSNRTGGDPPRAAAAWAVTMQSAASGPENTALNVAVIVPKADDRESVLHYVEALGGDPARIDVTVLIPPALDKLKDAVRDYASPAAICVVDADCYHDATPVSQEAENAEEEPRWIESVAYAARVLDEQNPKESISIILLLVNYSPPMVDTGLAPLLNAGVGVSIEGLPGVDAQSINWVERLRLGENSPLAEIEASESDPFMRAWTTARLLISSQRQAEAFPYLQPHLDRLVAEGAPPGLVVAAMAAVYAKQSVEAERLLHAALSAEPDDLWTLRTALKLARELEDDNIEQVARKLLVRLYPTSETALLERVEISVTTDDFREILDDLPEQESISETVGYIRDFSTYLAEPRIDVAPAVADLSTRWPNLRSGRRVAQVLLKRNDLPGAREALLTGPEPAADKGDSLVWLDVVRASFLDEVHTPMGLNDSTHEFIQAAIGVVSDYLLINPGEAYVREEFYNTMKPETSGSWGIYILASTAQHAFDLVLSRQSPLPDLEEVPEDDLFEIIHKTLERTLRENDGDYFLGKGTPSDPAPYTHTQVLNGLWRLIRNYEKHYSDTQAEPTYLNFLHVALLHASVADIPGERARLFERAAGTLWRMGNGQRARDFAENALTNVPDDIVEQVVAWTAFAEIYLVSKRPYEAVIGLSVLGAVGSRPIPPRIAYDIAYLECRLLRDLRLYELVPDAISRARGLATEAGIADRVHERLESVRLGTEIGAALSQGASSLETLEGLANSGLKLIQQAIEGGKQTLPLVMMLASAIPLLSDATTAAVRLAARSAENAASGTAREYLAAIADPPRRSEDLSTLFSGLSDTHHAEDAGSDLTFATFFARASLDREDLAPLDRLAIQDWLANHGVRPPDVQPWDGGRLVRIDPHSAERDDHPNPHLGPRSTEKVCETVSALAETGIAILGFARKNGGRGPLSVVASRAGGTVERVQAPEFNVEKYWRWADEYPYSYHEELGERYDLNAFEHSLTDLILPAPDGNVPLVFVPETKLQHLPPNLPLTNVQGRTAMVGTVRPVAAVPSLSWLYGALNTPYTPSGRRVAWIPTPTAGESFTPSPLKRLTAHVRGVEDLTVVTDRNAPDGLLGSDLAVIGAHGDVDFHGKRFLRGADEESQMFTATELASVARNAIVVVLFVCSGGGQDAHPFSPTVLGLPAAFLNAGCRAVIASPWPLNPRVARRWLPAFIQSLDKGSRIIEAVHASNNSVRSEHPAFPDHFLAMNLYGDPTLTLAL
jgi:hypothetical protein